MAWLSWDFLGVFSVLLLLVASFIGTFIAVCEL